MIALQGKITSLCYRAGGMDAAVKLWHQGCAINLTEGFCYFCPVKSKALPIQKVFGYS